MQLLRKKTAERGKLFSQVDFDRVMASVGPVPQRKMGARAMRKKSAYLAYQSHPFWEHSDFPPGSRMRFLAISPVRSLANDSDSPVVRPLTTTEAAELVVEKMDGSYAVYSCTVNRIELTRVENANYLRCLEVICHFARLHVRDYIALVASSQKIERPSPLSIPSPRHKDRVALTLHKGEIIVHKVSDTDPDHGVIVRSDSCDNLYEEILQDIVEDDYDEDEDAESSSMTLNGGAF